MNIFSIGHGLEDLEIKNLSVKYPFIQWGVLSQNIQKDYQITYIELEIHEKMIEDLDLAIIELLIQQNAKQTLKALMIRFQSIQLLSHQNMISFLEILSKKVSKLKVKILVYPKPDQPYQLYLSLFQKIKNNQAKLVFNPSYVYMNKQSVLSNYKALKKYIGCVVAEDINHQNNPELIGYGKASLIELFKYMIKHQYQEDILIDPPFQTYLESLKKKKQGMFKLLHKKDIDIYQLLKTRLKIDEKKDIQILDIYDNQIEVLSIIFNLR